MKKNYDTLPDGTIVFDEPQEATNKYFEQIDERTFKPKFENCQLRSMELRQLSCGRKRANYYCSHFSKLVSVVDCNACKHRVE